MIDSLICDSVCVSHSDLMVIGIPVVLKLEGLRSAEISTRHIEKYCQQKEESSLGMILSK
jgi:hypothetical protein